MPSKAIEIAKAVDSKNNHTLYLPYVTLFYYFRTGNKSNRLDETPMPLKLKTPLSISLQAMGRGPDH